ncbi:MAG: Fic family protein [Saprospiraceae bacterium]|nr:Fic family protein [Saprospiraceae bacterium]
MKWTTYPYDFKGLDKILARVQDKKDRLDMLRPLPEPILRNLRDSLSLEWTYHSNSIEGNTLSLIETKLVVEDGMTIQGKSLREHFEALNHQEAVEWIEGLVSTNEPLRKVDVRTLQSIVLQKIEKSFAGVYRTGSVRISGANFVPPDALLIEEFMDELISWFNVAGELPPLVKAAIFHHRFVWIHPFFDGNGRTVRLLMNLFLMRQGYPPAIILQQDRRKYYEALNRANKGNYGKLLLLVLQAAERTLDIYLGSVTSHTYAEYKPIVDIVKEADIPYSQEYVSLLARQGKIAALKEGRDWLTTKAAVEAYRLGRDRKR